ncbi:DUF5979 domain-containing protein [Microbacterium dextranolyticum]|uniref:Gram-positive cocci surface proteins LPxTG domain-containing protein n=1 Tax=Microbacterium dextranolyticum TaxID=36806 RepID=A0A9W6HLK6_9MICO|nr:DUF5979 domain-containing protein [Microbacterium dextranolyticum]MBM7463894.1 LPXTG-motif cell wall-anchored protein [Microbacterium dextranolyticum]GLJ94976.1 hypothetical protein GCM10017591_10380 [Microbacterium dextranolyticum]
MIAAVAVALLGAVAVPSAASAAQMQGQVSIDDIAFQQNTIEDGQNAKIDVAWHVPGVATPTVSFSIDLPSELAGVPDNIAMMQDGTQIGVCVVTNDKVTCTVDDDYVTKNPRSVSGDLTFAAYTTFENTQDETKHINIGGFDNEVVVKPSPWWCHETCDTIKWYAQKYGNYQTDASGQEYIDWVIRVPAKAVDGSTWQDGQQGMQPGIETEVTDNFDKNDFEILSGPTVTYNDTVAYSKWGALGPQDETWKTLDASKTTVSSDQRTVTFTSAAGAKAGTHSDDWQEGQATTGSWRGTEGQYYAVTWRMKPLTGGELKPDSPDRVFHNGASFRFNGSESQDVTGDATRTSGGANAKGTNFGSFSITKKVTNNTAADLAGKVYTVNAKVDEPGQDEKNFSITLTDGQTYTSDDYFRGTTVTLSEIAPSGPDGVQWATPQFVGPHGPVESVSLAIDADHQTVGTTTAYTLNNVASFPTTTFSAKKVVDNADNVDLSGIPSYELDYTYPAGAAFAAGKGSLTLPATGEVVTSTPVPVGAQITLSEDAPAPIAGATWADAQISPKTFTAAAGDPVAVTVTNTITKTLGGVQIVKKVEGPAAGQVPADKTYSVTASFQVPAGSPAVADRTLSLVAGTPQSIDGLPVGTTVTFSEVKPADDDTFTWADPMFAPSNTATVGSEATSVTLTNSVSRTLGTFDLAKKVTGDQAQNPKVPAGFSVVASWKDASGAAQTKTLTLPANGTAVPFGENVQVGTAVTLSEAKPADGSGITWAQPVWSGTGIAPQSDGSAIVTVAKGPGTHLVIENTANTTVAGLSIQKKVSGDAQGEVPAGTTFPVTASWKAADGTAVTKKLNLDPTASATLIDGKLPAGTVVTLTEGAAPSFPTVVWGNPSFTAEGASITPTDDPKTVTVTVPDSNGASVLVSLTNVANWAPGTFTLSKTVSGIAPSVAGFPKSIDVTASWLDEKGEPQTAGLSLPTDGTVVGFGRTLPKGTKVTLSEVTPDATAAFHWNAPQWAEADGLVANADGTATVTIGAAQTAAVALANSVTGQFGSVTITKVISGAGADNVAADTQFPVKATWTDLLGATQERNVSVSAAQPVTIDGVPLGTQVTLTEGAVSVPAPAHWAGATWSSTASNVTLSADGTSATIVVTAKDATSAAAALTLDNSFTADAPPLPSTGGDLTSLVFLLVGGVLIALAGLVLVRRTRRS